MTDLPSHSIISDLPIKSRDQDLFSFASAAKEIVDHIFETRQPESLVVGLSGAWGSGKTSFLNLIENELLDYKINNKPVSTLRYVPWRVKNRESLLSSFLPLLIDCISNEALKDPSLSNSIKKSLKKVRKYVDFLRLVETGLVPVAKGLSYFGLNFLEKLFEFTKLISTGSRPPTIPDLERLHQDAYETLEKLQIPVLVMIDGVDRLEPTEIVDMLRLVRATAQLPYITFVMSFDQIHVINAINNVLKFNGQEFLEKFIQLPVTVPEINQESLNLKFRDYLVAQINKYSYNSDIDNEKLETIIQKVEQTKAIETLRDVYRIVNTFDYKLKTDKRNSTVTSLIYFSVLETKFPLVFHPLIKFIDNEKQKSDSLNRSQINEFNFEEVDGNIAVKKALYSSITEIINSILTEAFMERHNEH